MSRATASFRTLVLHLLASFMGGDVAETRLLQLAVELVFPPMLYVLAVLPSYNGLMPMFHLRAMRLQVGDHFVLITYAYCVMALATLFAYERFFPTLQDLRILGVLPISARRLFAARLCASAGFFFLMLAVPNVFPSLLLLLGIDSKPLLVQAMAQAVSISLAAAFAASSVIVLLLVSRLHPLLESLMQGILLAAHTLLLLLCPKISMHATELMQSWSFAAKSLPPLWFTGLYESIWHGAAADAQHAYFARLALRGVLLSVGALLLAYPIAYWRQERQLLEGRRARSVRTSPSWLSTSRLRRSLLPTPAMLAGFSFMQKTMLRVRHLRTVLVLSLSTSIAIASVIGSERSLLPAPSELTACCVLLIVGGIFAACATQYEPAAGWVFDITDAGGRAQVVEGARRWLVASTTVLAGTIVLLISGIEQRVPAILLLALPGAWLASEYLFQGVHSVPFTRHDLLAPTTLKKLGILFVLLLPLSIFALHGWRASLLLFAVVLGFFYAMRISKPPSQEIEAEPVVFDNDLVRLNL